MRRELRGVVADDRRTRALYAADGSNYRAVPDLVVVPADAEDLANAVTLIAAAGAPVVLRGGGTSMAGNAIGGVVIDASRHVNRILEIDPETRTAVVEPGVVLTDLLAAAKPYGLAFGADPSSASRATLGGMIANNACGAHSVAWGTTADNLQSLDVVLADGTRMTVDAGNDQGGRGSGWGGAEARAKRWGARSGTRAGWRGERPGRRSGRAGGVVRGTRRAGGEAGGVVRRTRRAGGDAIGVVREARGVGPRLRRGLGVRGSCIGRCRRLWIGNELLIRRRFGQFSRQISGYALHRLLPEYGYNVAALLSGSEGGLAATLRATVRLSELPKAKVLCVLGFGDSISVGGLRADRAAAPSADDGVHQQRPGRASAGRGPRRRGARRPAGRPRRGCWWRWAARTKCWLPGPHS